MADRRPPDPSRPGDAAGTRPGGAAAVRLDDAAIEARLASLDETLAQLEQVPGRTAALALAAVETFTEVYGEALARVVDSAEAGSPVHRALTGDELLRHLLLLHRLHPDPVPERVARAVTDLAPAAHATGARIELVGVRDGVADIRLTARSCGSPALSGDQVREQVLAAAPELAEVRLLPPPPPEPAVIPVTALTRRPPAGSADPPEAAGPRPVTAPGGRAPVGGQR